MLGRCSYLAMLSKWLHHISGAGDAKRWSRSQWMVSSIRFKSLTSVLRWWRRCLSFVGCPCIIITIAWRLFNGAHSFSRSSLSAPFYYVASISIAMFVKPNTKNHWRKQKTRWWKCLSLLSSASVEPFNWPFRAIAKYYFRKRLDQWVSHWRRLSSYWIIVQWLFAHSTYKEHSFDWRLKMSKFRFRWQTLDG